MKHAQRYGCWYSGKEEGSRLAEFVRCRIISVISGFKTYQPQNISHHA